MNKWMRTWLKDEDDGKEPCNNKNITTTLVTKRMRKGSQDKDDNKEKNRTMMTKKMRSESQNKSDGEDFAKTKKWIQW